MINTTFRTHILPLVQNAYSTVLPYWNTAKKIALISSMILRALFESISAPFRPYLERLSLLQPKASTRALDDYDFDSTSTTSDGFNESTVTGLETISSGPLTDTEPLSLEDRALVLKLMESSPEEEELESLKRLDPLQILLTFFSEPQGDEEPTVEAKLKWLERSFKERTLGQKMGSFSPFSKKQPPNQPPPFRFKDFLKEALDTRKKTNTFHSEFSNFASSLGLSDDLKIGLLSKNSKWTDLISYLIAQKTNSSNAASRSLTGPREEGAPDKPRGRSGHFQPPWTMEQRTAVLFILNLMQKPISELSVREISSLYDHGKTAKELHPLRFLQTIFGDPKDVGAASTKEKVSWLKAFFFEEEPTGWLSSRLPTRRSAFLGELSGRLSQEKKSDTIFPYLAHFAKKVHTTEEALTPLIEASNWEGLLKHLIEKADEYTETPSQE